MMGQDKIKRFIRKYPGYVLAVCVGQLFLSLAFLAVILFEGRAFDNLRTAGEKQAEAAFSSVMHQMALAAEAEDLSVGQKKLILYGKAEAAMDSLAGTGYGEPLKRRVTEVLNEISRHMLEAPLTEELLFREERSFLGLFREGDAEDACRVYSDRLASGETEVGTEQKYSGQVGLYAKPMEVLESANRLFGVRGILSEEKGAMAGTRLFSCKNAYAVMNAAENYPLEAAIWLPEGGDSTGGESVSYTADGCYALARTFLTEQYPKKIFRRLSPLTETEGEDYGEVLFGDGEGMTVTVRISKASGRLLSLLTEGLLHVSAR